MKRIIVCMMFALILVASAIPAMAAQDAVQPGYRFCFGRFEQNTFTVDGQEPIVWRVLDVDEETGNVLIMSEFGLCTMQYHHQNVLTSWGDTDVRNWLNNNFLFYFTEQERSQIVPVRISGSRDDVFLLDANQIRKYLKSPYLCYATPWAKLHNEQGADVNDETGASSWLVRRDTTEKLITYVGGSGRMYIPEEGSKMKDQMTTRNNVVRPAMWVRREAVGREVTEYGFAQYAYTVMDVSTRSGPTTGYNGLGDYPIRGELVRVLSRVNDGSIWWLQIEFEYNHELVRCYTGLKRVDINISKVPNEKGTIGTGKVVYSADAYYGPGTIYKRQDARFVPEAGTVGTVVAYENGWYCFEHSWGKYQVRVWLPEDAIELSDGQIPAPEGEKKAPEDDTAPIWADDSIQSDADANSIWDGLPEPPQDPFERFLVNDAMFFAHGKQTLRVRSGPGTGFDQIGSIQKGTRFTVIATYESVDGGSGRWYKLENLWNGQEGFVIAGAVQAE